MVEGVGPALTTAMLLLNVAFDGETSEGIDRCISLGETFPREGGHRLQIPLADEELFKRNNETLNSPKVERRLLSRGCQLQRKDLLQLRPHCIALLAKQPPILSGKMHGASNHKCSIWCKRP